MPKGVYIRTEYHNKINSEAHKGKKHSDEWKQKISEALKGRKLSKEHRKNVSEYMKKLWANMPTKERRRNISLANTGRKQSNETKLKISNTHKEIKFSDEWKRNISKARKSSKFLKMAWAKLTKEERRKRMLIPQKAAQKANPFLIEKTVCKVLDGLNIKYKTQIPFCHGKFIVDIYIPEKKLVIECNGDYWHNLPNRIERDIKLRNYLNKINYKLIELWESEIKENPEQALLDFIIEEKK